MANSASRLFRELTEEELKCMLASVWSDASLLSYSLCSGGLFNTTYRVSFRTRGREQTVILRVGPVHRELLMGYEHHMMETETAIFAQMHKAGIPASTVLACNTERRVIDRDFMIVEYIDGVPFSGAEMPEEERRAIDREMGRAVRRMHEIECPAFGRATDVLFGRSYTNYFDSILAEVRDLCEKTLVCGLYTSEESFFIENAVRRHEAILKTAVTPRLCHGDLWSGNLLVEKKEGKWAMAALIDVDRAYFGDVDFDLGNPWILSDGFLEGYGIQREELETRERKIKRECAALIYFMIETYVWAAQYNGPDNAANAKRIVMEKSRFLTEA